MTNISIPFGRKNTPQQQTPDQKESVSTYEVGSRVYLASLFALGVFSGYEMSEMSFDVFPYTSLSLADRAIEFVAKESVLTHCLVLGVGSRVGYNYGKGVVKQTLKLMGVEMEVLPESLVSHYRVPKETVYLSMPSRDFFWISPSIYQLQSS